MKKELVKEFMPESCYQFEENDIDTLHRYYATDTTVVGIVESIDSENERLIIRLGKDIVGYLHFGEVTIYPFSLSVNPDRLLPVQITSLMGKQVCTKILSFNREEILLSRKASMYEAFEALKSSAEMRLYVTNVTSSSVFGDIGNGINARIPINQLCRSRIRSASEICHRGQVMFVKPIICDDVNQRFLVSYKNSFPEYNPEDYKYGTPITCTINEAIDDKLSGFFVNVSPQVVGILDYKPFYPAFHYGDKVECIVRGASSKGLHVRFSRFINK